jgi:microcystin degradation protein MlrC
MSWRVAIGQISNESSTFSPFQCDLDLIRASGYILTGADVLDLREGQSEVAGFLRACHDAGPVEVVPLIASRWVTPGVTRDSAFEYLYRHLREGLTAAGPIDALLLSCHGSLVTESAEDPEGDMLEALRSLLGDGVVIGVTVDLHANVTAKMVNAADILIGYRTYPHRDAAETGERCADLVLRQLKGQLNPMRAHLRLPMLLTAFNASTEYGGPYTEMMALARQAERKEPAIAAISIFFVGSYIDVADVGCSVLVITDGDVDLAVATARDLGATYFAQREQYLVEITAVAEALERGRQVDGGPVLLLDTSDTTGGGGAGDSIALVRELLSAGLREPAIAMAVDPDAAERCHELGEGTAGTLAVGHSLDTRWGKPMTMTVKVERTFDGVFRYRGGIFGGRPASMGPSAVVSVGPLRLLIQSVPTYDWEDEQYQAAGLAAAEAKFVGVKNMMNFRRAYGAIAKAAFVLDLPGPTAPDMRMLEFQRAREPWFPRDPEVSLDAAVLTLGLKR